MDGHCVICLASARGASTYGSWSCPQCGTEYEYDEGDHIALTEYDLRVLRSIRKLSPDGMPSHPTPSLIFSRLADALYYVSRAILSRHFGRPDEHT